MAPDTPTISAAAWDDTPPWPAIPAGIAVTRLSLTGADVLATAEARRVPLPPAETGARPRRQADYIAGRLCAARALARLGGGGIPARRDDGVADWPDGFTGSISHTAGLAAAAASTQAAHRSLGIDVEQLMPAATETDLTDFVLTRDERARFAHRPIGHLVTLAFCAKEALFKALYPLTEVRFDHEDAELVAIRPDGTAMMRLRRRLSSEWTAGSSLPVLWRRDAGFCLCLTWVKR